MLVRACTGIALDRKDPHCIKSRTLTQAMITGLRCGFSEYVPRFTSSYTVFTRSEQELDDGSPCGNTAPIPDVKRVSG